MNEFTKKIVVEYTDDIFKNSSLFLMGKIEKDLDGKHDTGELLNIVLSSHLSACFQIMERVASASDNPDIKIKVTEFIYNLKKKLLETHPIAQVEINE
jgi:hypothetical protein